MCCAWSAPTNQRVRWRFCASGNIRCIVKLWDKRCPLITTTASVVGHTRSVGAPKRFTPTRRITCRCNIPYIAVLAPYVRCSREAAGLAGASSAAALRQAELAGPTGSACGWRRQAPSRLCAPMPKTRACITSHARVACTGSQVQCAGVALPAHQRILFAVHWTAVGEQPHASKTCEVGSSWPSWALAHRAPQGLSSTPPRLHRLRRLHSRCGIVGSGGIPQQLPRRTPPRARALVQGRSNA